MNPLEVVREVRRHLEQSGRVSYRMLRRQFELDDDALEELIEELVDVQRIAVREERALVWSGDVPASRARPEALPAPPERDPRAYTPKHLADKILQSKSALEGERKQVTVLFADVKGSMELAEQLDPEEWHAILDRFFQILSDGVHRFEGTINQYTGDGIMALFGAPIAHEDHAQRACYAALWLRDELRRYADELRRRELNFSVRMGLNSGEVIVGKIGDDLRMDYTAQGHTVGLAQRMEQLAEPGRVCLSVHTARLVEGYFELRDLGEARIRGVEEPLGIHELEGVGAFRTRLDRSQARGFSKFVGRARETALLEALRDQSREGNGQVVGVVADAGVGKSRLCFEFLEGCRAQGIPVLDAHCPAHGKTVPFLPLLELLRACFGLSERDGPVEARQKIAGTALLLDEAFRELLPLLFDFLGVPDPDQPPPSMDSEARQRQLFAFVRRLVQARSQREPTVLFVDDLHWIDPGSDGFLAQIVEAVSGTRTLLLVNFRPEYHAEWMAKSYYQQLPLVPLGPAAIQELLDDLLGRDESLVKLPDLIRERTGGNPFFIEEVVQSLVESGSLTGTRGAYRLEGEVGSLQIPGSVQTVLDARIDRLAELDKRVLQTAAVIGKLFPHPVLVRVAEVADAELAGALATLESAEFILQETLYPELVYGFKHPLTQEVALHSQLAERRARLHASVAHALIAVNSERLDETAALIAYHLEEAGEALEASRWHRRAAEWAGVNDAAEADAHWAKVDELLAPLERTEEIDKLQLGAISQRLKLGVRVGLDEHDAEELFQRGDRLARESDDLRGLAILEARYGVAMCTYNHFDACLEHSQIGMRAAERLGDPGILATLLVVEIRALAWFARFAEWEAAVERGLELIDGDPDLGSEVFGFGALTGLELFRGAVLAWTGRLLESEALYDRAIHRAREQERLDDLQVLNGDATLNQFFLGNARKATAHAQQAVELAEKIGAAALASNASYFLCWARLCAGDWPGVLDSAERCRTIVREKGVGKEWLGPLLAVCSTAQLELGDTDAARTSARESVAIARRDGLRIFEMFNLLSLAQTLLYPDAEAELEDAESALVEAGTMIEETGASTLAPRVCELRARLARLRGDETGREQELEAAHRLYGDTGAAVHAERLARELKELRAGS